MGEGETARGRAATTGGSQRDPGSRCEGRRLIKPAAERGLELDSTLGSALQHQCEVYFSASTTNIVPPKQLK